MNWSEKMRDRAPVADRLVVLGPYAGVRDETVSPLDDRFLGVLWAEVVRHFQVGEIGEHEDRPEHEVGVLPDAGEQVVDRLFAVLAAAVRLGLIAVRLPSWDSFRLGLLEREGAVAVPRHRAVCVCRGFRAAVAARPRTRRTAWAGLLPARRARKAAARR